MSDGYTKLFATITDSTIWAAPDTTRLVWITMLAMADQHGYVGASVPGLAARARVPLDDCIAAIETFLSPDKWSRTPEFEGRRITTTDGGWILLNHAKYRAARDKDARREQSRIAMAKLRADRKAVNDVSKVSHGAPPFAQAEAEATTEAEAKQSNTVLSPPAEKPPKADPIPYQKIIDLYHQTLPTLPKVAVLTAKRKGQIGARWRTGLPDLPTWKEYFEHIGESGFLMGKSEPTNGHKRFVADLEWITNETNFAKIAEGKYHGV